jgi:hypothetical protein
MDLTASLVELRGAYGQARRRLAADKSPAAPGQDPVEALDLAERLVEELPADALRLSCIQATLARLVRDVPGGDFGLRWRKRLGCYLYAEGLIVREPLFSLLFDLKEADVVAV